MAYCMKLTGEDLLRYSNKIVAVNHPVVRDLSC